MADSWEPRVLVLLARVDGSRTYILARNAQEESWESPYPAYEDMYCRVAYYEFECVCGVGVEAAFDENCWVRPQPEPNHLASALAGQPLAGDVFLWGPTIEGLYIEDGHPAVELP